MECVAAAHLQGDKRQLIVDGRKCENRLLCEGWAAVRIGMTNNRARG